jgi:hypothetical protein
MASSLLIAVAFLGVNVLTVWSVLILSRQSERRHTTSQAKIDQADELALAERPASPTPAARSIQAGQILGWEFEYARVTASEAMHDRHTMVNYYLLIVGIAVSAAVNAIGAPVALPSWLGAALLWLLCGVGWLYFLKLIRLRQAWYDSAQAMNQIKEFCIRHNQDFTDDELRGAFRWQAGSLPTQNKSWTLFFFSALLIAFLSSSAYFVGGLMLELDLTGASIWLGIMVFLAVCFFAAHVYFYFAFLQQR